MSANQIIYVSGLAISVLIAIFAFSLHVISKRKTSHNNFLIQNSRDTVWNFTKRNFWMFLGSFALVMIFSFGALLLSTI